MGGIEQSEVVRRPASEVWSAVEYAVHSAFVTATLRQSIEHVIAADGWVFPEPATTRGASASDAPVDIAASTVADDLEREGRLLADIARDADPAVWAHRARMGAGDGAAVRADGILFHAVHDASHHQMDVGRGLAALGAGVPVQRGRVSQINTSSGGVPKQPVARVEVAYDGVVGDRQADTTHHGRPFQAVCLWSTEVVDELVADGHGVFAGCVGENFTLTGIDWSSLRPGGRMRIGSALIELSFPAVPCQKQKGWFHDGDFTRIAFENNPQWVRWYGWVREPGEVSTGDEAVVA
jgi:MOSC domain-containing protein YiiM